MVDKPKAAPAAPAEPVVVAAKEKQEDSSTLLPDDGGKTPPAPAPEPENNTLRNCGIVVGAILACYCLVSYIKKSK